MSDEIDILFFNNFILDLQNTSLHFIILENSILGEM